MRKIKWILMICILIVTKLGFSHGNEVHEYDEKPKKSPGDANIDNVHEEKTDQQDNNMMQKKYQEINQAYQKILPIMKSACFDCHSNQTRFPWYYKLPLATQVINHDITNAKTHLVMGESFPFEGHGTPKSDLMAIKESILTDEMPPFRYKIMHWDACLSNQQKEIISQWVDQSIEILNK